MDHGVLTCCVCGNMFARPNRPGRPPVACSDECNRKQKNKRAQRARMRAEDRGCPDELHGTASGYSNYRCSCFECMRWARTYQQQRRAKMKEHGET